MEGIAAAASIIAIIETAGAIVKLCGKYLHDVQHASQDIQRMQSKASALQQVLTRLKNSSQSVIDEATVQRCCNELSSTEDRLQPKKRNSTMKRLGFRALKWPLTSEEVEEKIRGMEGWLLVFSTTLQLNISNKVGDAEQDRYLEKLSYVGDVPFNSYVNGQRHRSCLEQTRVDILKQVMDWSTSTSSECIFWLKGMAGTGKSTIAVTVASRLQEQSEALATYFFKRGLGDLAHARGLIPTIAWQLSQCSASYRHLVTATIREVPGIGQSASIRDQYEKLLVRPLQKLQPLAPADDPFFIIIDALDECEEQDDLRMLLRLLAKTNDIPNLRLRILVTSRPELPIRLGFAEMPGTFYRDLTLQDVSGSVVNGDIEIFLRHELKTIQQEYRLPLEWPVDAEFAILSEKAAGLFIFAATACRYIGGSQLAKPQDRLRQICDSVAGNRLKTEELDQMYTIILRNFIKGRYTEEEIQSISGKFRDVVGRIVLLLNPLSVVGFFSLLGDSRVESRRELEHLLQPLHALLIVPEDIRTPIQLLHLSFRDFLLDQRRCLDGRFWVDETQMHRNIALDCTRLLSTSLRRNICNLPSVGTLVSEVDQKAVDDALPQAVQYACHFWVDHVEKGDSALLDHESIYNFLRQHFLHWLEAMSLMKKVSETIMAIEKLVALTNHGDSPRLRDFSHDCHRFVLAFRQVVTDAPGQLYISALIFSPLQSNVRIAFEEMTPRSIKLSPQPHPDWNNCLQTLECDYGVYFLQFSYDSQLLASADDYSLASSLDFWDPRTGTYCSDLKDPVQEVTLVLPSPDFRLIGSVTNDNVFRIWDIQKHEYRFALKCRFGTIEKTVFSRDGQLIALKSVGGIIRVVETQAGTILSSLENCFDKSIAASDFCLAFSPDSKWLICDSEKGKMGLWLVPTGKQHSILEGGLSMAFSHDSKLLALGSANGVIRLWDVSANAYRPILEGHSDQVRDLMFSPDDQLLASGSRDRIVRLWNVQTGNCHAALEGHTVAFSPEGNLLALGSSNGLVRLWNISQDVYESTFKGHTGSVDAICFSPDGRILATGSFDRTIRLWDVKTRGLFPKLESKSHTDKVIKVTYSPNKQLVATCQYNKTVLWNATTGDSCYVLNGGDASFSADSQLLLSSSLDGTVFVRLLLGLSLSSFCIY